MKVSRGTPHTGVTVTMFRMSRAPPRLGGDYFSTQPGLPQPFLAARAPPLWAVNCCLHKCT